MTSRADADGLFAFAAKTWSTGTHGVVVMGKTTTRTGGASVKITK